MDGALDTSDEDESEESDGNMDDDDNDDLDKDDESDIDNEGGAEEEPLNSEDDVTDEDATDLFDTDNVIVCQYDKVCPFKLLNIAHLLMKTFYFLDYTFSQQMEILSQRWYYEYRREGLCFSKIQW